MGLIKVWSPAYPGALDERIVSMPLLTNNVDDVIASHPNALADSLIAVERENIGYKDNSVVTAATLSLEDQLDVERVIGSAVFDGADLSNLIPHLRAVGIYNLNGGAAQGDLRIRMYDMGPPGSPLLPPELRATASISNTDDGNIAKAQVVLTPTASPGIDMAEIFTALRTYEFRVILDGAPAGATAVMHWAGIALGVTQ
jgi:hypothetical protein